MPVTLWKDIIGYNCGICGGSATHWYGNVPLCCDCHAGEGMGLVTREQAEAENPAPRTKNTVPETRHAD